MSELTHRLTNTNSDRIIQLTLKGSKLISETGKADKLKATEKDFSTNEEALKNFYKKEWEALKKGFSLINKNASRGESSLHKFIGGGYTGSLSFQQTPKGIYVYKNAGQGETFIDQLVLLDHDGNILKEVTLPKMLAWNIEYRSMKNSLMVDVDHYIYEFDVGKEVFANLGNRERDMTSFISVADDKIAFATFEQLSVLNNDNQVVWQQSYEKGIVKGSVPFCGKLSRDGKLLAFHNKVGRIQILEATTGALLNTMEGDFEMINQMEFTSGNAVLVVREQYKSWGMRYFDIPSGKEIKQEGLDIPDYSQEVTAFCFNADQSKLVLVQRAKAHVFDFNAKNLLHSFSIEHVVKKCNVKFIGDDVGVRTDYGCFSLYVV